MGRVKKHINWDKVEFFVRSGATQRNIARYLRVDEDTLRERVKRQYGVDYSVFSAELHSEGDLLIEAAQMQKALKGNTTMLIWLGKVRLGQKEPEPSTPMPPAQEDINKDHEIMRLKHENDRLREMVSEINAHKL